MQVSVLKLFVLLHQNGKDLVKLGHSQLLKVLNGTSEAASNFYGTRGLVVGGVAKVKHDVVVRSLFYLVKKVLESMRQKFSIKAVNNMVQNELDEVLRSGYAEVTMQFGSDNELLLDIQIFADIELPKLVLVKVKSSSFGVLGRIHN